RRPASNTGTRQATYRVDGSSARGQRIRAVPPRYCASPAGPSDVICTCAHCGSSLAGGRSAICAFSTGSFASAALPSGLAAPAGTLISVSHGINWLLASGSPGVTHQGRSGCVNSMYGNRLGVVPTESGPGDRVLTSDGESPTTSPGP